MSGLSTALFVESSSDEDGDGEKVRDKYKGGLKGKERKDREDEIEKRRKMSKDDPRKYKPGKTDKGVKTKKSSWTKMYKAQYGDESGGSVEQVAKDTGLSKAQLQKVYSAGIGAFGSDGSRPGTTAQQWALARLYAFVMKAKHKKAELNHDHDVARELGLIPKEKEESMFVPLSVLMGE